MTVESTLSPQYGGKNVVLCILKYIEARRKSILFPFQLFISRFEVLTAVFMKSSIFWDITPPSLSKVNQGLG
jgi:hypothetical protein